MWITNDGFLVDSNGFVLKKLTVLGLAHIVFSAGDSDLQSMLGGMSQQQLMQLLGIYQTSIFPWIQQYIHDLSNALKLSLIVLISSQISWKCSF